MLLKRFLLVVLTLTWFMGGITNGITNAGYWDFTEDYGGDGGYSGSGYMFGEADGCYGEVYALAATKALYQNDACEVTAWAWYIRNYTWHPAYPGDNPSGGKLQCLANISTQSYTTGHLDKIRSEGTVSAKAESDASGQGFAAWTSASGYCTSGNDGRAAIGRGSQGGEWTTNVYEKTEILGGFAGQSSGSLAGESQYGYREIGAGTTSFSVVFSCGASSRSACTANLASAECDSSVSMTFSIDWSPNI